MKKKLLLPVSLLTLALTACGGTTQSTITYGRFPVVEADLKREVLDPTKYDTDYLKQSASLYNNNYGAFVEAYTNVDSARNLSERYALQAIAEAKLLENGTLLPGQAEGGNYAISRVVPRTITPVLWGNDNMRYHNALVKKGNPLTAAERNELIAKYSAIGADSSVDADKKQAKWEGEVKAYFAAKGYTFNDVYSQTYSGDPETFDIQNSYYAADAEPLVNTFDGLVEYDDFNTIQPALATSWEKIYNPDPTSEQVAYVFTIREGAKWVSQTGADVADVKADDFVAGFQHMLDCQGGLEYLVDGLIVGVHDYLEASKETKDFSQVGVVANGNTVTYVLEEDCPYFLTMLGYSIFAPLSRSYYESQGGKFGKDFDPTLESYLYAKDYGHIAYCGPYTIKTYTPNSTFEFEANAKYWNKDNINIKKIIWLENDGSDPLRAYNLMKSEEIAGCGLNTNAVELAKKDGIFDTCSYVSTVNANTYPFYINLNRAAYANSNDNTVCVSGKTAEQKAQAEAAFKNVYIRLGIEFAIDRVAYFTQSVGEELACNAMTNSYTPGNFVQLEEITPVLINGKLVTYPAGTYYGEIMQDQIDADGYPMKVWNKYGENGLGSGYGFDGWHNTEAAVSYFKKGVEELKNTAGAISEEKPLCIELTTNSADSVTDNQIKAMGSSIQAALGKLVNVTYCDAKTRKNMLYAEYYPSNGNETNCDIMTISGWGPDFGDPCTYLDTFLPLPGGMLKCSGIF